MEEIKRIPLAASTHKLLTSTPKIFPSQCLAAVSWCALLLALRNAQSLPAIGSAFHELLMVLTGLPSGIASRAISCVMIYMSAHPETVAALGMVFGIAAACWEDVARCPKKHIAAVLSYAAVLHVELLAASALVDSWALPMAMPILAAMASACAKMTLEFLAADAHHAWCREVTSVSTAAIVACNIDALVGVYVAYMMYVYFPEKLLPFPKRKREDLQKGLGSTDAAPLPATTARELQRIANATAERALQKFQNVAGGRVDEFRVACECPVLLTL